MLLYDIFLVLWVFLPAGVANVTPILAAKFPGLEKWETPIDGGATWRGKRVLGAHKTWRGLITGIIAATILLGIQQLAVIYLPWLLTVTANIHYAQLPTLIVGPLFALGALGGDALKSFFKRQLSIQPGHSWFPFDQIDYILGGAIAILPFIRLDLWQYAVLIIIWLAIHLASTYTGWLLGLKDEPI